MFTCITIPFFEFCEELHVSYCLITYCIHYFCLKKKPEKLIFEYDIILRLLAEYQPKDYIHPATCIQALVEHFEFEDFIQYVMEKSFIILTLVIRYIIYMYFEDKRSAPNMDSNTFNIYRESLCFDTKRYHQINFPQFYLFCYLFLLEWENTLLQ